MAAAQQPPDAGLGFATDWVVPAGWTLTYLPITGSTNDDAKSAALAGSPDRSVFLADEQTRGRGRLGRTWQAPPRACLLFSIVFRRPVRPIALVALCSVSVVDAIHALTRLSARIKWPNDVMLGDCKVSGLLAEVVGREETRATIVGIGLNVNLDPVAAGLPATATSLSHASGRAWTRPALLNAILTRIDRDYGLEPGVTLQSVWPRWERFLWRRQQQVRVDASDEILDGTVEGLAPSGALRIRDASGRILEVSVGDLLLTPPTVR
jgi:BirA family biotin operon repressor/biotin-[acetyl-CoA-carboxylase] ligase